LSIKDKDKDKDKDSREKEFFQQQKAAKQVEQAAKDEKLARMSPEEREKYESEKAAADDHKRSQQAHLNRLAVSSAGGKKVIGRGGGRGRGRGGGGRG
jgi:hypothetical protein